MYINNSDTFNDSEINPMAGDQCSQQFAEGPFEVERVHSMN